MSIDASSWLVKLLDKAIATESAARKALAVLQKVEWGTVIENNLGFCPSCFADRVPRTRHADDCALAEAISDLEKVL